MVVTNYRMSEGEAREQPFVLDGVIGKEVLLCFVCSQYYKDPRVLPCQHTFCRGCLQRYHDLRQAESTTKTSTIPCPKCQSITQVPQIGVTGFPHDTKLRQMKEVYLKTLRKGNDNDSGSSQRTDTQTNGGSMPYSAQDKENISNGRFAYRRRESPRSQQAEQDRPSSWYGQTTTETPGTGSTRPSPRSSWYGGGSSAKKPDEPPVDNSRNPFDRASRFAPRRRRKMERTFDTNDDRVGFKPRDRLEEIINNVREEGTSASATKQGSYRERFFGSAESMNGTSGDTHHTTDSPLFGSAGRRGKSPTRSHSFNIQRPKAYEPAEKSFTRPERSSSFHSKPAEADVGGSSPFSFTQSPHISPPRTRATFGDPSGATSSTPTDTGTPTPPPRTRNGPRSPSSFAKPSPEPPKFKPKPPPQRTSTSSMNSSYESKAQATASNLGPQLSPGARRSESEPPTSSSFYIGERGTPRPAEKQPPKVPTPEPVPEPASPKDTVDGASPRRKEEPIGPPPDSMDDETRELYEKMRDYYKRRAEEPPKDIPDIESLMRDSSDSEESDTEEIDTKTGPSRHGSDSHAGSNDISQGKDTQACPASTSGRQSPALNGPTQNGATEHVHNSHEPTLTSDTFSNYNVGPDSEEAFAEVGEMQFENAVIHESDSVKMDSGSDYDNASDYDNLDSVPDEILRIVEDGDELESDIPLLSPKRKKSSVTTEIKVECPQMEDDPFLAASSTSPSYTGDSPKPQFQPSLLWKLESSEYEMPTSIAFTSNANLVVAEYSTGCLQFFDEVGTVKNKVEGIKPFAVAVNKANHVIVGDRKSKTIRVFDDFGYDVMQWEDNTFKWLCGIATTADGNFITFDREFCKIRVSSPNGEKLREFGTYGKGDTQFTQVDFLTVDSNDRIIVCDSGNHCVKIFDSTGKFLDKFGTRGDSDGQMEWPKGICVDCQDNIILTDSKNRRVTMYSPNGEFIQHLVTDCPNIYNVAYTSPGILGVSQYSLSGKSQVSVYTLWGLYLV